MRTSWPKRGTPLIFKQVRKITLKLMMRFTNWSGNCGDGRKSAPLIRKKQHQRIIAVQFYKTTYFTLQDRLNISFTLESSPVFIYIYHFTSKTQYSFSGNFN